MFDKLIKLVSFLFFIFGIYMVKKEIDLVGWKTIWQLIKNQTFCQMICGIFLVYLNYCFLEKYDLLGLSYLKKKAPCSLIKTMSCISFAVSNVAGHVYASGGAIRYLFLKPLGFQRREIFLLIGFILTFISLGMMCCFLLAVVCHFVFKTSVNYTHPLFLVFFSFISLFALFIYFKEIVIKKRLLRIKKICLHAPTTKESLSGILIGIGDFLSLFLVFYLFLPSMGHSAIHETVTAFVCFTFASVLAYLSQVPAGIGVFESLFLIVFPHATIHKSGILAALILYRVFYFILPFLIACIYLVAKKMKKNVF